MIGTCVVCGRPFATNEARAIAPGQDAVYGMARDMFDHEDRRLPPILLERSIAATARHWPRCST